MYSVHNITVSVFYCLSSVQCQATAANDWSQGLFLKSRLLFSVETCLRHSKSQHKEKWWFIIIHHFALFLSICISIDGLLVQQLTFLLRYGRPLRYWSYITGRVCRACLCHTRVQCAFGRFFFHICIYVPQYIIYVSRQTLKVQVQIVYCCVSLSEEVPVRGLDAKSSDNGAEFWTLHTSGYTTGHYATLLHVFGH